MDIQKVSLEIASILSKSFAVDEVTVLHEDASIGTIRIVASIFEDQSLADRLNKVIDLLETANPLILTRFHLTFVLLSKFELESWVDYVELNKKSKVHIENQSAKTI